MITFLKKFMKYFCRPKIIFFSGLLVLFFLSLPLPALAFWERLVGIVLQIPVSLAAFGLIVAILISAAIAAIMGAFLDWVISPGFISLSYTRPCPSSLPNCNPIIGMGLNITQSFVNLILVVILVYIALAIALRIEKETEAKKILFRRLIIVALLVNFAPVFCGLIVDASNIIMNYFLEPIRGGTAGVLLQSRTYVDTIISQIKRAGVELVSEFGLLGLGVTQIFLNYSIALAFFLFAGLFIVRYVALWVLVILAPLAFVFWILPQTKKLWDMWWNNFIQWSIIGIPMAFFLYLAIGSYGAITEHFRADLDAPGIELVAIGTFNELFPFFIVIVFLVLGFLIGLSTSAMGAAAIIKGGKAAGMVAGKKTWQASAGFAAKQGQRMSKTYKAARRLGLSRPRAVGVAAQRYLGKVSGYAQYSRARRMGLPKGKAVGGVLRARGRAAVAAARGVLSTLGSMAVVGGAVALGVKVPKPGKITCPTCKKKDIAKSAIACPGCGHVF